MLLAEKQREKGLDKVGQDKATQRQVDENLRQFPLAAELVKSKRVSMKNARDYKYMEALEKELKESKDLRKSVQASGTRVAADPRAQRRFLRTFTDKKTGIRMYRPPHTTNSEKLFTNNVEQWGYGQKGGSWLGELGSAAGGAGAIASATGIGAAAGVPLAVAGGTAAVVDGLGEAFDLW